MLVTFKTDSYSNVTLFGNIALTFLKIMGHSGNVPGSISAAEVPAALSRLSKAVASEQASPPTPPAENDDEEPSVSLKNRALPLIDLLSAAAAADADIMWE